jgi:hypothetical protein
MPECQFPFPFSDSALCRYGGGSAVKSWHAGHVPGTGTTLASGKRERAGAAPEPEPESEIARAVDSELES